jgi:hypothetical protein
MATYVRLRGISRRPFRVDETHKLDFNTIQTVDIDNYLTQRCIRTYGEGRYITVSNNDFDVSLGSGTVAVSGTTDLGVVIRAPRDLVIKEVTAFANSNSGSASVDLELIEADPAAGAGTSIYADLADMPLFDTGDVVTTPGSATTTAWGEGEYLRVSMIGTTNLVNPYLHIVADLV